jgi:hypothetical protein
MIDDALLALLLLRFFLTPARPARTTAIPGLFHLSSCLTPFLRVHYFDDDRLATQGGRNPSPPRPFHPFLVNSAAERPRAMTSTPAVHSLVRYIPAWTPWLSYKPAAQAGYHAGQDVLRYRMQSVKDGFVRYVIRQRGEYVSE